MSPEEKLQKTALKALWKKMLVAHGHIVILQDKTGKMSLFTNLNDTKDIAYSMTYIANDLLGKAEDFDALVTKGVTDHVKKMADKEVDEMENELGDNASTQE